MAVAMVQEPDNKLDNKKQEQDTFDYICDSCEKLAKLRYHCTICFDFDLCSDCFNKDGHEHEMEKCGSVSEDGSAREDQKEINPRIIRMLYIRRFFRYLSHACQCKEVHCTYPSCLWIKRVLLHNKKCKQKNQGGCQVCKELVALCCHHANHCQDVNCRVPFCVNVRNKVRLQQLHERLMRQARLFRERIAAMQNHLDADNVGRPRQQHLLSQTQIFKRHISSAQKVMQYRGF